MDELEIHNSTSENLSEPTANGVENNVETNENVEINNTPANETVIDTENAPVNDIGDGDKFAKAFSKRLNKEREKLAKEYEPFKKVIGLASKQFNMSETEYIESILKDYADEEGAPTTTKEKDERDILIEELLNEKKEKEVAKEWETQAKALKEINPNINMDELTDEMFELSYEKNIPLEYIYAHNLLTKGRESFEKTLETKIREKIQKVNTTAGALTSQKVDTAPVSISSMNKEKFNELKERVKRGEKINL